MEKGKLERRALIFVILGQNVRKYMHSIRIYWTFARTSANRTGDVRLVSKQLTLRAQMSGACLAGDSRHVDSPRSFTRAEMHVGFCVKCRLLFTGFNQIWNVSTNFSKTAKYQVS
jgi:hypothetical protein